MLEQSLSAFEFCIKDFEKKTSWYKWSSGGFCRMKVKLYKENIQEMAGWRGIHMDEEIE